MLFFMFRAAANGPGHFEHLAWGALGPRRGGSRARPHDDDP